MIRLGKMSSSSPRTTLRISGARCSRKWPPMHVSSSDTHSFARFRQFQLRFFLWQDVTYVTELLTTNDNNYGVSSFLHKTIWSGYVRWVFRVATFLLTGIVVVACFNSERCKTDQKNKNIAKVLSQHRKSHAINLHVALMKKVAAALKITLQGCGAWKFLGDRQTLNFLSQNSTTLIHSYSWKSKSAATLAVRTPQFSKHFVDDK